jgi:NitT/TauT family transport system substrate-binding protein
MRRIDRRSFLALSGGLLLAAACGGGDESAESPNSSAAGPTNASALTGRLRLGFFPNVTHAQPNVGIENGVYARALGDGVDLDMTKTFNSGTTAIEALFAGEIDATYIGPNPAINGFMRSGGKEVRIIAGATSGGALFVVRPRSGISAAKDFANKKVATPSLGNTQDVALRAWLKANGLSAKEQGGNVNVIPTQNPNTLQLFQQGEIDAAWVPEPWGTRLIQEAGGQVFLDERDIWPHGQFVTTHLVVKPSYLEANPGIVEALLRAHVELTQFINQNAPEARKLVNNSIEKITTARLPDQVIDAAWQNIEVTYDPIAESLQRSADHAYEAGFLDSKPDLSRIYDLTLLNKVLKEEGLGEVRGLG